MEPGESHPSTALGTAQDRGKTSPAWSLARTTELGDARQMRSPPSSMGRGFGAHLRADMVVWGWAWAVLRA